LFTRLILFSQVERSAEEIREAMDSVIINGIQEKAFPGAVLYLSQGDCVLVHKAYGYHTYDSVVKTQKKHLFDLASVTKVTAGTVAIMLLSDQGLLDIDAELKDYLTWLKYNKRGSVTIREVLAHESGLRPWIPYYQSMIKNGEYKKRFFRTDSSKVFNIKVKDDLYLTSKNYQFIKKKIKRSEFDPDQGYAYSGLFFYTIPEIVQNLSGQDIEVFLDENFYDFLDAKSLMFNPLRNYPKDEIVPTEIDTFFRMMQIHGLVHDEGAAIMGGLSTNAGLFGNAEDLAKVWRVFLNDGVHDTTQLINPRTIDLFTTTQYPHHNNRRGLGFDKPLLEFDSTSSVSQKASWRSYGHSGYTGPLVWADPAHDLLFIFLCNRVYPNRLSRQIYELNIRPTLHDLSYELIHQKLFFTD
jgi:CubicO group peptidase (beta-lactamase class C family)